MNRTLSDLVKASISLHSVGKHRNAIYSTWVTSGSFELADNLGKKVGMETNRDKIFNNLIQHNQILNKLTANSVPGKVIVEKLSYGSN